MYTLADFLSLASVNVSDTVFELLEQLTFSTMIMCVLCRLAGDIRRLMIYLKSTKNSRN